MKPLGFGFALFTSAYIIFMMAYPLPLRLSVVNAIIAIISAYFIFIGDKSANSLAKIFFFCCIVFLSAFPRIEFNEGIVYYQGSPSVFNYYTITSVYSFLGIVSFAVLYFYSRSRRQATLLEATKGNYMRTPSGRFLICLSAIAVVIIYFINDFSLIEVFFRTGEMDTARMQSSYLLVYQTALRPLPSICLILYLLSRQRNLLIIFVLALLMFVGNPITGLPRWQGAMLYMAVLLAGFPRLLSYRNSIIYLFAMGFVFIFPALDVFRRYTSELKYEFSLEWIYAGHFDSFQIFARAVEIKYVTWGQQLLGVFFFFVPRGIWEDKPISSSAEVARLATLAWDNVGMNFLGEGYVNFSIFGVLSFAAFLGWFCGWLDRRAYFWEGSGNSIYLFWLFFLGGVVFLVRGALLSAFAYMVGTYVASIIVSWLAQRKRTRRGRGV